MQNPNSNIIFELTKNEFDRQKNCLNLIASENLPSPKVLELMGSVWSNKYGEGYPGKRYYAGNQFTDELESFVQKKALEVFDTRNRFGKKSKSGEIRKEFLGSTSDYTVNVQVLSGSPANAMVFLSVLNYGDTILSLNLANGGHLSHLHATSNWNKFFKLVNYDVKLVENIGKIEKVENQNLKSQENEKLEEGSELEQIISKIQELQTQKENSNPESQKPFIIAIDGRGGSGKSSSAQKISQNFKTQIIKTDDFITFFKSEITSKDYYWDKNRFEQDVLLPLKNGQNFKYNICRWKTGEIVREDQINQNNEIIIIEGLHALHQDLLHFYDLKIWVDTPLETSLERGKIRDLQKGKENIDELWNIFTPVQEEYILQYKPQENADIVISTENGEYQIVEELENLQLKIILQKILDLNLGKKNKPFVIGISGIDTSGKTTFTKILEKELKNSNYKTQIIHIDDFHNPKKTRYSDKDELKNYYENSFNYEVLNQLLEELKIGDNQKITLDLLDLESDTKSLRKTYQVDENTIILVEGVFLFRKEIVNIFDLKIWLEIDPDKVIERAIKRGELEKYGQAKIDKYSSKYIPTQKIYIENHRPQQQADLVISTENEGYEILTNNLDLTEFVRKLPNFIEKWWSQKFPNEKLGKLKIVQNGFFCNFKLNEKWILKFIKPKYKFDENTKLSYQKYYKRYQEMQNLDLDFVPKIELVEFSQELNCSIVLMEMIKGQDLFEIYHKLSESKKAEFVQKYVEKIKEFHAKKQIENSSQTLIHHDLHFGNFIVEKETEKLWLVDFDFLKVGEIWEEMWAIMQGFLLPNCVVNQNLEKYYQKPLLDEFVQIIKLYSELLPKDKLTEIKELFKNCFAEKLNHPKFAKNVEKLYNLVLEQNFLELLADKNWEETDILVNNFETKFESDFDKLQILQEKNNSNPDFETNCFEIDEADFEAKLIESKPKLTILGGSSYPRLINFAKLTQIAHKHGSLVLADVAHINGLIAAGLHFSPFQSGEMSTFGADFVTMTTHKTLRGPRGAMIFMKKEWEKTINKTIFPGTSGGPHFNKIAAIGQSCLEILGQDFYPDGISFEKYSQNVLDTCKALETSLAQNGLEIVSPTQNHMCLIKLPSGSDSLEIQQKLEKIGIICNRNVLPFDQKSAWKPSGLRLGTAALTSRGLNIQMAEKIGRIICDCVFERENQENLRKEVEILLKSLDWWY
jgi:glycine/serine hydroxymethyltransferase/uridine kinase